MNRKEELIEKLFNSQSTAEELSELLHLLRVEPNEHHTAVMKRLWEALGTNAPLEKGLSERIVERAMAKVQAHLEEDHQDSAPPVKSRRYFLAVAGMAAVLLLSIGALAWHWLQPPSSIVIQTAFAEQKDVELPDGSLVHLNANSTLTYPAQWPEKAPRQAWLQGEAFFQVRKRTGTVQKFQVHTNDLTVEVLGTAFNVNTHQQQTKVFLEEGRVKLELKEKQEPMFLEPGEQATYSVIKKIYKKKYIEIEHPASWKDGVHVFENQPLWHILQRIEEIYGVKIKVTNQECLKRTFKVAIPVDDFETTLQVLQEVTKLDIREKNGHFIIL